MTIRTGTQLTAPIIIQDSDIPQPSHFAKYGQGGLHSRRNIIERDAIEMHYREAGMEVVLTQSIGAKTISGTLGNYNMACNLNNGYIAVTRTDGYVDIYESGVFHDAFPQGEESDNLNPSVRNSIQVGNNPSGVAFIQGGNRLAVTNKNDNTVSVIDIANMAVISTLATQSQPHAPFWSQDGRLGVCNFASGSVSLYSFDGIEWTTNHVLTGTTPYAGYFTEGSEVYVINKISGTLSKVNFYTQAVENLFIGANIQSLDVNADFIAMSSATNGRVYLIDRSTDLVSSILVSLNKQLGQIKISPNVNKVFVTNVTDGQLVAISLSNFTFQYFQVGSLPYHLDFIDYESDIVCVSSAGDKAASIVNTNTGFIRTANLNAPGNYTVVWGGSGFYVIATNGNLSYIEDTETVPFKYTLLPDLINWIQVFPTQIDTTLPARVAVLENNYSTLNEAYSNIINVDLPGMSVTDQQLQAQIDLLKSPIKFTKIKSVGINHGNGICIDKVRNQYFVFGGGASGKDIEVRRLSNDEVITTIAIPSGTFLASAVNGRIVKGTIPDEDLLFTTGYPTLCVVNPTTYAITVLIDDAGDQQLSIDGYKTAANTIRLFSLYRPFSLQDIGEVRIYDFTINTNTLTPVQTITGFYYPNDLVVDLRNEGGQFIVANRFDNSLVFHNLTDFQEVTKKGLSFDPAYLTLDYSANQLLVTSILQGTITLVNLTTLDIEGTIEGFMGTQGIQQILYDDFRIRYYVVKNAGANYFIDILIER